MQIMGFDNRLARPLFIAFGALFAAVATLATLSRLLGDTHPTIFVIGPVLVSAGSFTTWMGVTWFSDGANGRVGGGPFMSVRLMAGESVQRAATTAVYRDTTKRFFGNLGAGFENDNGRVYLTDRRLIYCPTRFRPDRCAVNIALRDIRDTGDRPPWQLSSGRSGMTLTTTQGKQVALWLRDPAFLSDIRESIANTADLPDAFSDIGRVFGGPVAYGIVLLVAACITMSALVVSVETPPFIVGFFIFSLSVGLVGIAPMVIKYLRQSRRSTPNSLS